MARVNTRKPEAGSTRFGIRLRNLRLTAGLSQRELSVAVGIDFTYLSKLENGRGPAPAQATITRLAEKLGADPIELAAIAGKVPSEIGTMAGRDFRFAALINALPDMTKQQLGRVYAAAEISEVSLPQDESTQRSRRRRPRRSPKTA